MSRTEPDDDGHRRALATRLAGALGDGAALPLLQLLCDGSPRTDWDSTARGLGPFASLAEDALGLMASHSTGRPAVGIWELDPRTGECVRSRQHVDLWHFCADVDSIPRKGSRRRVVFLGESVARGFFFDPFYSPARVLEAVLSANGEPVEVVDLAQSNQDPWSLAVTTASAQLLEPDALVVFAGNNWRGTPLANRSAEECAVDGALLVRDRGLGELLARQRQALETVAAKTVRQLAGTAEDLGIPLVLVIPELNLADWQSCPEGTLDVPVMSDGDTRAWVRACRDARAALEARRPEDAVEPAREAVALDGGVSAASLALLARAEQALGCGEAAALTLRRSRDLTIGALDGTRPVPGVYACVAEVMRRVGREEGARVVDLPLIFRERAGGSVPGRTLFLDYCHLGAEAIRVAMAAVASALASPATPPDPGAFLDAAPSPTPEQEAWAHLLAGIHNAHWGQPAELCAWHIGRAVECHPPLRQTALPLVYDSFRRGSPPALLAAFDELVRHPAAAVYLLGYGHNLRTDVVSEQRLTESILAVDASLGAASPDPDFRVGDVNAIDLLHPHWSELTDGNRWFHRAFSAAYQPESAFSFQADGPRPLLVHLTCRIPGALEEGEVEVELNGAVLATLPAGGDWSSTGAAASPSMVRAGENRLVIRWPLVRRDDARPPLRRAFDAGQPLDLRTHFGHLHALGVRLA